MDTIKALDPDNAAIIRVFTEYEQPGEHVTEIAHRVKASPHTIRLLAQVKAKIDHGENVTNLMSKSRSQIKIADDVVIKLIESGESCAGIAREFGTHEFTVWKQLHDLGYTYNKRLNRWGKDPNSQNY